MTPTRQINGNLAYFFIKGVGSVMSDLNCDDPGPVVRFASGESCIGPGRTRCEVEALGYESIAEANFIHESIHLFLSAKCDRVRKSVLFKAATGCAFNGECHREACDEEQLVVGLQVLVNDALDGDKVSGFNYHLAAGAMRYAEGRLREEFNLDIRELRAEFREHLRLTNCYPIP